MKRFKKVFLFLSISILMLNLIACGDSSDDTLTDGSEEDNDIINDATADEEEASGKVKENTMPITTEDITLTYYVGMATGARQVYNSMAEHPVIIEIMRETGINLEFVHPPEGDDGTFFNTMVASGDLPDIIYDGFGSYPGGATAAMDDGVLLDHKELIEEYAYYFTNLLEEGGPEVKRRVLFDDGRYKHFGCTFLPDYLDGVRHGGMITRQDFLDRAGIDKLPVTIAEYEEMFDAYLKELDIVPWATTFGGSNHLAFVTGAYGVRYDGFQLKEGKVVYSRTLPEYKDFLEKIGEWYAKGYMTSDAFTQTASDTRKSFQAGTAGAIQAGSWELINIESVGKAGDPDFQVVGLSVPRHNADDIITTYDGILTNPETNSIFISADCKHPTEAIRLIDYTYKPETLRMTAWGINTDEYTLWEEDEDGNRAWTDYMVNNPDVDYETLRRRYTASDFQGMWDTDMEKAQYEIPIVQQAWEQWSYNTENSDIISKYVTRNTEEEKELSTIMTEIESYADAMVQKFISRHESLDKFDEFVEQLKQLGIERACEIHQESYNRYLER